MNIMRTISEVFDFGFEQMDTTDKHFPYAKSLYHWSDFAKGGKMYRFSDYTIDRFENQFKVNISFC